MILNKLTLRYYAPELMNFQLAIVGDRLSQFLFNFTDCSEFEFVLYLRGESENVF